MNLKNVNSVAELVLENERTLSPEERAAMALAKCDTSFHLGMCKVMIQAIRDYHVEQANQLLNDGDTDQAMAWAVDVANLSNALDILEQVELD